LTLGDFRCLDHIRNEKIHTSIQPINDQRKSAGNMPVNGVTKGNATLEITTLGGLSIRCDGQPLAALHSRKAEALLVYLAVTGRPQSREVLAALLWEAFSQKRAMNNLRVVLSNLRKHLGDHLLITRDTAGMKPGRDYELDVAVLDRNLTVAGEFERKTGTLDIDTAARIEQAVDLYNGEFLEGFFVENAMEFDAWMVVERERYHHIVMDGLGKLVRWELEQGEYTIGIRHASKWVQLEPLSEAAYRQIMRLLASSGQRSAALAQYEKCREVLANELGVEPETKTTTLYEQIRVGELSSDAPSMSHIPPSKSGVADVHRHNLPVQTTPFIGRETELTDLNRLLTNPDVKLVTVLGAGGMGKTRLALEAGAGLLDQFSDGVFFVPLSRLGSAELLVPSIIQVLGIEFAREGTDVGDSQRVLKDVLLNHLRRKQLLLILDNFEHLLDGVDLVGEILQAAPELKIMATSRTRLNVSGEYRFRVAGMAYPDNVIDYELRKFGAVRLFLESARRAQTTFALHEGELKHIANICRLVEGMPLGIRLAAAWVGTLSPEEIAAEIAQNIDLLETDLRDIPERHRSIRALFNHSWNLLSAREQRVFQGFSIFRGGCTREAAQEITGAALRDLRNLVDKSLLHRALNGRYEIHELSREYAAEKLQESVDTKTKVQNRHAAHYAATMQALGQDLKSRRQLSALTEMDLEIGNARAAWSCAVERGRADLVDMSLEGFRHYFAIRNLRQEAERTFRQASERFISGSSGDEERVYARLLSMQGYFTHGDEGKRYLFQQSLKVLDQLEVLEQDVRHEKAQVLNFMGDVASRSDFDESLRFYNRSLRLFKELGDRYWASDTLDGLGRTNYLWGKMVEAQEIHQQNLVVSKELGDLRKIAQILGELDYIFRRQGEFEKAEGVARERSTIYETIGDPSAIAEGQAEIGYCLKFLGEFEVAETFLKKAMDVHKELEIFSEFFTDARYLCSVKLDLGQYVQAYDLAQSALDWSGGRFSWSLDWGERDSETRRLGITLTIQGMASLALEKVTEAEHLLQRSFKALQEIPPITITVYHHFLLGIVSLNKNQPKQAKGHIRFGLQKGVEIGSSMAQISASCAAAFFLAEQGDLEGGVEIYAMASRYPWIGKSQWYQDVIGDPLTTLTASLPAEVISAAQKRGRERDLEETVIELLAELG
jgi:predicted ATPase/DNA-binding SARP family transcriptional activator